jgi:hypothetical protein
MRTAVRNGWLMGVLALLTLPFAVYGQQHSHQHGVTPVVEEVSGPPSLQTARVATAAFDHKGRVWLAWAHGEHVYVNHSDDLGKSFSAPVVVNGAPQKINQNGESRPLIVVDGDGRVYVAWSQALPKRFTGHIRFSRSLDGGKKFSEPMIVNDNQEMIGHSFVSMALDSSGELHLMWLDSRDANAAKEQNAPYEGSSLYYASSSDHGASFNANRKLADHTCQCCRIALALDENDQPVALWRHIFASDEGQDEVKNSRDHAVIQLNNDEMHRISFENWQVESCPHHGPTLAIADDGRYHMAWFNQQQERPGLYYAWSDDQGKTVSPAYRFSGDGDQAQHPYLLVTKEHLYLVWKSFDGQQSHIHLIESQDRGQSWSRPTVIASSASQSDHPFLLQRGDEAYLSWQSQDEGYRLIKIAGAVQ